MKNKILISLIILSSVLGIASCMAPVNKDTYLERFTRFVDNVRQNYRNYNAEDWEYADKRFNKFSKEWHDQFRDDLSIQEELKVGGLIVQYNSYKSTAKIKNFYNDELKEDVDKLKEEIQYYIDNDMDEDLEKLKEGAREIGDSTLRAVEEIIRKIKD